MNRSARTLLAFVLEADVGPLIGHMLEASDWQVLVAASEAEAGEFASTARLDLLVLEVTPDVTSRSAAERLRMRAPGLPVLYLSAWHDHPQLAELKGEPILAQPFSRDQVLRAIAGALGRAAGAGGAATAGGGGRVGLPQLSTVWDDRRALSRRRTARSRSRASTRPWETRRSTW